MFKSENSSLTFFGILQQRTPLPAVGGDEGEGGPMRTKYFLSTPTRTLPHRKGEGTIGEISNMSGWTSIGI